MAPPRPRPSPAVTSTSASRPTLSTIYAEHHAFVWRSVVRLGVPSDRVDDAVHDVFMVVARRLDEFEGRASMRTWLFAIAMRVAQGLRRDAAREMRRRERLGAVGSERTHAPHDAADAKHTLLELLDRLDDEKRAVFVMAELEGMTAQEIAAVIGGKVATVYSRLRLARTALERLVVRAKARDERGAR
ncbi:MAG TPA: RNA polymerase sigma factor [Nannocystaceae bacterium]|nr:RNA polymerase sigma factor [Nannocystaceae bacterium]